MTLKLLFILTVFNSKNCTKVTVEIIQRTNNKIFGIMLFLDHFFVIVIEFFYDLPTESNVKT